MKAVVLVCAVLGLGPGFVSAQDQERAPREKTYAHGGFFFESNILFRLSEDRFGSYTSEPAWYVTWDAGFLHRHGVSSALGVSVSLGADRDGTRFALRPRFRHWLDRRTTVDIAAGLILIGDSTNTARHQSPGFFGLVSLAHGNWIGGTVEVERIRSAHLGESIYDPATGRSTVQEHPFQTDWGLYAGVRFGGTQAAALTILEVGLIVLAAATLSGF